MTKTGKRELLEAIRPRYLQAGKADKCRILDEFVTTTGYHRKYASQCWPNMHIRSRFVPSELALSRMRS